MISDKDGMISLYVPAGNFLMGSTDSDPTTLADEKPQHTVYLDAFWIDQTEVTNAMYAKCVSAGACNQPASVGSVTHSSYYGNSEFDYYPVIDVNWNMADAYCKWAGGQLPTEAQWEKAARGSDGRTYPWGEGIDCSHANYSPSSGSACEGDTTAVGSYEAGKSPYGAYDMAGNVEEWVDDWYSDTYYSNSPSSNPLGSNSGQYRVYRGGDWHYEEAIAKSRFRDWMKPEYADSFTGFRCARGL